MSLTGIVVNSWRGLPLEDLRKVSGIKTATFVHASGFIGGCKSHDDALLMASKALDMTSRSS
ncbi:hypothetical protein DFQ28_001577 [Apophysomyces sp. BC1034]|nr:hypothetical protein DFQ30_008013 [Apophysomyces sp. BC1015]KAG0194085.1 hypothetical protein DFQ28_001577 [Apophysomyces sp. BC1034]